MKLIGLSLSFCIQDILNGKVQEEDVEMIICGTKAATPQDWSRVLNRYSQTYWRDRPDEAIRIAHRLSLEGKLVQPRLQGVYSLSVGEGHWAVITQL